MCSYAGRSSLVLPAVLLLLYLVTPIGYLFFTLPWHDVAGQLTDREAIAALVTSLLSATLAILLIALFGVPLGYLLARRDFPGRGVLTLLVFLPLESTPTTGAVVNTI